MNEAALPRAITELPVNKIFSSLKQEWSDGINRFIIQAEPGAGKSTGIPLFLLHSGLSKKKILMLEPRRMAARSLAGYLSRLLHTETGEKIGYRVRGRADPERTAVLRLLPRVFLYG